jgi:hypothetical protein
MRKLDADIITRENAIKLLHHVFVQLTDKKTSMCKVAGECDIFCRGFRALNDLELRERYGWLMDGRGRNWREEMEARANRWELLRQEFDGASLVCDIVSPSEKSCRGWDEFSNDDLGRFCGEIFGGTFLVTDQSENLQVRG